MNTFSTALVGTSRAMCCLAAMVAIVCTGSGVPAARACDTPVYRYAMYNWPSVPYRIFYYHHGQPAEEDAAVNRTLSEMGTADPSANVLLQQVDVSNKEQFEQYPKPVVDAWKAHGSEAGTLHVVFSPWAAELFSGRLEAAKVEALVDSPARKRLGELLQQGNVVVWLMLSGSDADANKQAEKVANEVISGAAAGKFASEGDIAEASPEKPAAGQETSSEKPPADQDAPAAPKGLKVAMLKLSRDDPAETWLVRSLLAIEPDLEKLTAEPMVFAVYGRGRAMPPCVGKGVTTENLIDCLEFLSGPCSCMIKDENPGADLLMRWDWEATAEALAAEEEQMNEGSPGARETVAGGPGPETKGPENAAATVMAAAPTASQAPAADASLASVATEEARDSAEPSPAVEEMPPVEERLEAAAGSYAVRLAWTVGIGLAVVGIVLVGASAVLVRRQRAG